MILYNFPNLSLLGNQYIWILYNCARSNPCQGYCYILLMTADLVLAFDIRSIIQLIPVLIINLHLVCQTIILCICGSNLRICIHFIIV